MGQRISTEQKEAALKRLLPPHNESVKVVSEQTGIGEASLYKWRLELQRQGAVVPGAVTDQPSDACCNRRRASQELTLSSTTAAMTTEPMMIWL